MNEAPTSGAPREQSGETDAQTERALSFVRVLLDKMQMNAEVLIAPDDGEGEGEEIRLEIEGPDAGRIIGKRGNVLEAIQYLTMRVVGRMAEQRRHISVDAEGYRARHEEQLSQMAQKLGERVAVEGKIITFDPMSARDRRVVHMAVRDMTGVRTESSGEGPDRRVQLIPTNMAAKPPGAPGAAGPGAAGAAGGPGGAPQARGPNGGGGGGAPRGPRPEGGGGGRSRGPRKPRTP